MAKDEFGPGREFFSEWHRDAYVDGFERELAAAQNRLAELEANEDASAGVITAARERVANAERELKRLGRHAGAEKRPAGKAKETR